MSIENINGMYLPVCDNCGDSLDAVNSFSDAVAAKEDAGWVSVEHGGYCDACPDCQEEI